MEKTVVVFGAGATKACKVRYSGGTREGPLTNEILLRTNDLPPPDQEREHFIPDLRRFLAANFNLPYQPTRPDDFPPLPMLLSLLDAAIERGQEFREQDKGKDGFVSATAARAAAEYATFAVIERDLANLETNPYLEFFQRLKAPEREVAVVSLNYDIIADNSLIDVYWGLPDYGTEIATDYYNKPPELLREHRPIVLKLHGSLNWLYCPNPKCHRLDVGISEGGKQMVKVLNAIYATDLADRYSCKGSPCKSCGTNVRPIMITPTHRKSYENPHVAQIWKSAASILAQADRVHIIGYSLPPEDVDVIYLLKRNLAHLDASRITVVDRDDCVSLRDSVVGNRYRALFGDGLDWRPDGFESYARTVSSAPVAATSPAGFKRPPVERVKKRSWWH